MDLKQETYGTRTLVRFLIKKIRVIYHAASTKYEVNKCRRQLFAQYGWQLENLPPTQDLLKQHVLRAVYQAALFGPSRWYLCKTFQVQMNGDGTSKEVISCHAGWRSRVYLRRVTSSLNVHVRRIRDVLEIAPVRNLDYHA